MPTLLVSEEKPVGNPIEGEDLSLSPSLNREACAQGYTHSGTLGDDRTV